MRRPLRAFSPFRGRGFTLIELLVVIAIIAALIGVLLPVLSAARGAARASQTLSNMRQIALGLHAYAEENRGHFPLTKDADDQPTWFERIRPQLDHSTFYRDPSDTSEMWNDPVEPRVTSYGLNAYLSPNHPPYWGVRLDQIRKPSQTIAAAELADHIVEDHFTPMLWGDPVLTPVTGTDPSGGSYDFTEDRDENWDSGTGEQTSIAAERHRGVSAYTFTDGHAATHKFEETFQYDGTPPPSVNWYDPMR